MKLDRRKKTFDADLVVAWLLDVEAGYRETAKPSWQFVELEELPGAARHGVAHLSEMFEERTSMPDVRILVSSGDRVAVNCDQLLTVQRLGETSPQHIPDGSEVAHGSVVRSGALLFAVLDKVLYESVSEGRLELPVIGEVRPVPDGNRLSLPSNLRSRWRSLWMLVVAAFVLLLVIAGVLHWTRRIDEQQTDARLVRLRFTGVPEESARKLLQPVTRRACHGAFDKRTCLDTAIVEPEGVPLSKRQGQDLSQSNHLLDVHIEVLGEQSVPVTDHKLITVRGRVQVFELGRTWPVLAHELEVARSGETREKALERASRAVLFPLRPMAYDDLLVGVAVDEHIERSSEYEPSHTIGILSDARVESRRRRTTARTFRKRHEQWEMVLEGAGGSGRLHCLIDEAASQLPLGITPDGKSVLLQVERRIPVSSRAAHTTTSAQLQDGVSCIDRVDLESGERTLVARVRAFAGLGDLSANGSEVTVLERYDDRHATVITIDLVTGRRREHGISMSFDGATLLRLSSDGGFLTLRATHEAHLVDLSSGERHDLGPYVLDVRWVELAIPEREGNGPWLAVVLGPETRLPPEQREFGTQRIDVLDPRTRELVARVVSP